MPCFSNHSQKRLKYATIILTYLAHLPVCLHIGRNEIILRVLFGRLWPQMDRIKKILIKNIKKIKSSKNYNYRHKITIGVRTKLTCSIIWDFMLLSLVQHRNHFSRDKLRGVSINQLQRLGIQQWQQ